MQFRRTFPVWSWHTYVGDRQIELLLWQIELYCLWDWNQYECGWGKTAGPDAEMKIEDDCVEIDEHSVDLVKIEEQEIGIDAKV